MSLNTNAERAFREEIEKVNDSLLRKSLLRLYETVVRAPERRHKNFKTHIELSQSQEEP